MAKSRQKKSIPRSVLTFDPDKTLHGGEENADDDDMNINSINDIFEKLAGFLSPNLESVRKKDKKTIKTTSKTRMSQKFEEFERSIAADHREVSKRLCNIPLPSEETDVGRLHELMSNMIQYLTEFQVVSKELDQVENYFYSSIKLREEAWVEKERGLERKWKQNVNSMGILSTNVLQDLFRPPTFTRVLDL